MILSYLYLWIILLRVNLHSSSKSYIYDEVVNLKDVEALTQGPAVEHEDEIAMTISGKVSSDACQCLG